MRATRVREKVQLAPPPLLSDTVIAQRNSTSSSSGFENYKWQNKMIWKYIVAFPRFFHSLEQYLPIYL